MNNTENCEYVEQHMDENYKNEEESDEEIEKAFSGIPNGPLNGIIDLECSIIRGFNNLGLYHCPICDEDLITTIEDNNRIIPVNIEEKDVKYHIINHYHKGEFNKYICLICKGEFY